jgi:hypothetical protein
MHARRVYCAVVNGTASQHRNYFPVAPVHDICIRLLDVRLEGYPEDVCGQHETCMQAEAETTIAVMRFMPRDERVSFSRGRVTIDDDSLCKSVVDTTDDFECL